MDSRDRGILRGFLPIALAPGLLISAVVAEAGVRAPLSSESGIEFTADLPVFPAPAGGARVDLAVRVDHPHLDFERVNERWIARCEMLLKLARRGEVALDTTQVFVLEARDAEDAANPLRFQLLELSAAVPPGRWAATVRLRDRTVRAGESAAPEATVTGVVEVPRWPGERARLSDPEYRLEAAGESLPNPARLYGVVQDTLQAYLELRDAAPGRDYLVDVEVFDPVYGGMDRQMLSLRPEQPHAATLLRLPLGTFPEGRYVLRLTPQWDEAAAGESEFTVSWRIQRSVQAARDVAIEAALLLDPDEFREFKQLSRPAQSQRMQEFWDRRDPSPGTVRNEVHERFLERLGHANQQFGELGTPGALSDRGRIYVQYGPPAEVSVEVIPTNREDLEEAIDSVHDTFNMELWGTFARNFEDFEEKQAFVGLDRRALRSVEAVTDRKRNEQRIGQEGSFELWVYHLDGDPLFSDEPSGWSENVDLRFLFVDRLGTGVYRLSFDNVETKY